MIGYQFLKEIGFACQAQGETQLLMLKCDLDAGACFSQLFGISAFNHQSHTNASFPISNFKPKKTG